MEVNMEHKDIYDLLKTLDIPVAYDHFDSNKNVNPPFIAYREMSPDTFKADGITYYRPYEFEIELVTEKKDVALEKTIEDLLTNNKIPYDVESEVWDEDERIYHNFYEI
jgi:hypothetical protein